MKNSWRSNITKSQINKSELGRTGRVHNFIICVRTPVFLNCTDLLCDLGKPLPHLDICFVYLNHSFFDLRHISSSDECIVLRVLIP